MERGWISLVAVWMMTTTMKLVIGADDLIDPRGGGGGPQSRFLSPAAYEGLGRLFALHGELASCHSCSALYPNHAESCCSQGYSNCCLNGPQSPYATSAGLYYTADSSNAPVYYQQQLPLPIVPYTKEGLCPSTRYSAGLAVYPSAARQCLQDCLYDSDCPLEFKCCWTGCSTGCSRPAIHSGGSKVTFVYDNSVLCSTAFDGYSFKSGNYPLSQVLNPPCIGVNNRL